MIIRNAVSADIDGLYNGKAQWQFGPARIIRICNPLRFAGHSTDYWSLAAESSQGKLLAILLVEPSQRVIQGRLQTIYELECHVQGVGSQTGQAIDHLLCIVQSRLQELGAEWICLRPGNHGLCLPACWSSGPAHPVSSEVEYFIPVVAAEDRSEGQGLENAEFDELALFNFYSKIYRNRPVHFPIQDLPCQVHFTCRQDEEVKSALSVFESEDLYFFKPSIAHHLIQSFRQGLGSPVMHSGPLRILRVHHSGFADGYDQQFLRLLAFVQQYAAEEGFHYCSLTVPENEFFPTGLVRSLAKFQDRGQIIFSGISLPRLHTRQDEGIVHQV